MTNGKNRDDLFKESYSSEYREKILQAASNEMAKLEQKPQPFWQKWWVLAGPALAGVLGIWLYQKNQSQGELREMAQLLDEDFQSLVAIEDFPEDLELLEELELLENMEELESWEDS